jgi:hypothetical protein
VPDANKLKALGGRCSAASRGLGHETEGQRWVCALAGVDLRVYRRPSTGLDDGDLRVRLKDLWCERWQLIYWRLHILLWRTK